MRRRYHARVSTTTRDYGLALRALPSGISAMQREQRMQAVVDVLWNALNGRGVSWLGFYVDSPGEPDDRRLMLGPCRDKPACSPIGLHGACGQALRGRTTIVVRNVADLGPNYIACDPRDRSEVVIPLVDEHGAWWGVFDVDSWEVDAFDDADVAGFRGVLLAAGLLVASAPVREPAGFRAGR